MKLKKLFFGVMVMLFTTSVFSGCTVMLSPLKDSFDSGMYQVRDLNELKDILNSSNALSPLWQFDTVTGTVDMNAGEATDETTTKDYSQTNNQVEGVDEGDTIKTDGNRIYSINQNILNIVEISDTGVMNLIKQVELDSYSYASFSEIYVTDNYLVAVGYRYQYYYLCDNILAAGTELDDTSSSEFFCNTPSTVVYLYDINSLDLVHEYEISGYSLTSRLIGDNLYFMTTYYPYYDTEVDPRPLISEDDVVSMPEFSSIKYFPNVDNSAFTIISGIKLTEQPELKTSVFLGSGTWGQIYVSTTAVYFADTFYDYGIFGKVTQYGKLIAYELNADTAVATYGGVGNYDGYVLNQFSIDEYNGFVRLVATENTNSKITNRLYVFEKRIENDKHILKQVGLIDEGLGKTGEQVKSVRFNGDTATVVTYVQTDPLYIIDLSDPYNPVIFGELEISGYSTYQHNWGDNYLLGVGYEAEGNIILGIKLALYDITDPNNPITVGEPLVLLNEDNSWQYSEALYNHKAILVAEDKGFIGFAISKSYYYLDQYVCTNDYLIFNINPQSATPITITKSITHSNIYTENEELYTDRPYISYYGFSISRAVYIGNFLYAVSGEAITAHDIIADYTQVQTIIFEQE